MTKKISKKDNISRKQATGKRESDLGTPELENHYALETRYVDSEGEVTTPDKGVKQVVNRTQSTMDYCFFYKLITAEQYDAGERLYLDCLYAGFTPRAVITNLDNPIRGSRNPLHFIETKTEADLRYAFIRKSLRKRFVDRQSGVTFWEVAYEVCCDGLSLDGLEKRVKWTRRSGKLLLRMVLDEVAGLYEDIHKGSVKLIET